MELLGRGWTIFSQTHYLVVEKRGIFFLFFPPPPILLLEFFVNWQKLNVGFHQNRPNPAIPKGYGIHIHQRFHWSNSHQKATRKATSHPMEISEISQVRTPFRTWRLVGWFLKKLIQIWSTLLVISSLFPHDILDIPIILYRYMWYPVPMWVSAKSPASFLDLRSLPLQGVAVECLPLDDYYGFRILPLPQSVAADPIDFATTEGVEFSWEPFSKESLRSQELPIPSSYPPNIEHPVVLTCLNYVESHH